MQAPLAEKLLAGLQPASAGVGPLLQRDYWAVVRGCRLEPADLISFLRSRFVKLPPADLLTFTREAEEERPLEVGDDLAVDMKVAGMTGVRVVHAEAQSMTLGTHEGHPEAGRITFGAYANRRGDVIFHIRSRARALSLARYAGFLAAGDPMQTNTWTDFIDCLAHAVGDGVVGAIQTEVRMLADPDPIDVMATPTFVARGT